MMKDNPDGLGLATPWIAFQVDDLETTRAALVGRGVHVTDVGESPRHAELRVLGP